ncbi:MAG TPA: DinB family protein [Ignavibacteria bacterium]|nr:DinB family protein [Ignavibacteria bacterium]
MEDSLKTVLWKQFGAAIDMFENAVAACPDALWNDKSQFWYNAYHCIFYLDYYLSEEPDTFRPPAPFTLSEFNPDGEMPERIYTKEELITYIKFCREKCRKLISSITEVDPEKRFINQYRNYSQLEILLYNMRHVQHHAAQLNLLIRQSGIVPPDWVSRTKIEL